ncbi:dual specificity protein kinase TTK [Culicoides brevitarsis]|uniref:dual specificity protein kinase TTK n=1 Tax=Culicoides brevitarsis TaxID=469753 RepID=UPI00307B2A17
MSLHLPKRTAELDLPNLDTQTPIKSKINDTKQLEAKFGNENTEKRSCENPSIGDSTNRLKSQLDEKLVIKSNQRNIVSKGVLKLMPFTTPNSLIAIRLPILETNSKNHDKKISNSSVKKSPTRLQIVKSFAPPKARQLFSSDGREILGDSKKSSKNINTPTIFRSLISGRDYVDSENESSILGSTLNDVSQYSRIENCEKSINISSTASTPKSSLSPYSTFTEKTNNNTTHKISVQDKNYVLVRNLGKGGSGCVIEGQLANDQISLNKKYAIKMVELDQNATYLDEYLQEIKILKRLQNSDCIIKYFGSEIIKDNFREIGYIVMELGQCDLYQHLRSRKEDIPLYELVGWLYQMIEALYTIHYNGIIHCDLKPANFIMVNGILKLADFGISMCNDTSREVFVIAGTCNFLSPESVFSVLYKKPVKLSGSTDIWSFGIICYYLIYKKLPFEIFVTKDDKLQAIADPKTVIQYPELPDHLPEILHKITKDCLQYDSSKRPTSIQLLTNYDLHKIAPLKRCFVLQK